MGDSTKVPCGHTTDTPFRKGCEHPWCPAGIAADDERRIEAGELRRRIEELDTRRPSASSVPPTPEPSERTGRDELPELRAAVAEYDAHPTRPDLADPVVLAARRFLAASEEQR